MNNGDVICSSTTWMGGVESLEVFFFSLHANVERFDFEWPCLHGFVWECLIIGNLDDNSCDK